MAIQHQGQQAAEHKEVPQVQGSDSRTGLDLELFGLPKSHSGEAVKEKTSYPCLEQRSKSGQRPTYQQYLRSCQLKPWGRNEITQEKCTE